MGSAQLELDKKLSEHEELSRSLEAKKNKMMECVQQEISSANNIKNFEERLDSNQIQLEKRQEERTKYETELAGTKETLSLLEANLADNNKKRTDLELDLSNMRTRGETLRSDLDEKEKAMAESRLRLGSISSRMDVLSEISNRMEKVSSGTKFVFESEQWKCTIKGFLADTVTVAA